MKKLFFIFFIFSIQTLKSSPQCWDYKGRWLRRSAMQHVDCNCNCERQYHFQDDDKKGYRCWRCEHKLVPTEQFV